MDTLWAGWRSKYVGSSQKSSGCIFCDFARTDELEANHILYRGELSYIVMNKFPYSNGHLMVIPKRHLSDFTLLTAEESAEVMLLARYAVAALRDTYSPHGFNIGWNIGSAGGAGIAAHMHMHIVPRWEGDTNFMPVIGETKVIPEDLDVSFARIKSSLDRILAAAGHE